MPWKECTPVSERLEFVALARGPDANLSLLSRRFRISRRTAYKWLTRARAGCGVANQSRRPLHCPRRTPAAVEALVCQLREQHPAWGGRKLRRRLQNLGVDSVPAASTITGILDRNGLLHADRRLRRDWQRFQEPAPNRTWQMDFKGHFPTARGPCHPLTVIDDHSRFNLCLAACPDERRQTVQAELTLVFQRYGLPDRILTDNGPPWAAATLAPHTRLSAWLIRNGISVAHGRPAHPQTQGKDERFHRSLVVEVIHSRPVWSDLAAVQVAFNAWRHVYNFERPHEALGLEVPATRYTPSWREYCPNLPPIEYGTEDIVRRVQAGGFIAYKGRLLRVGKALVGEPVALRPTGEDGVWDVYYCHQVVRRLDLASSEEEAEV